MSEYNHDPFPCDMPANTPDFDKGYEGIKWNDKHDDLGRVVKKEGEAGNSPILKKGDKVTIDVGNGRILTGIAE